MKTQYKLLILGGVGLGGFALYKTGVLGNLWDLVKSKFNFLAPGMSTAEKFAQQITGMISGGWEQISAASADFGKKAMRTLGKLGKDMARLDLKLKKGISLKKFTKGLNIFNKDAAKFLKIPRPAKIRIPKHIPNIRFPPMKPWKPPKIKLKLW